jgi:DNA topoisomerase VI subunit B
MEPEVNDFSWALTEIKHGLTVRRAGWNGKGMFIFLVPGSTFQVNREPLLHILGEGTVVNYHAHIDMKTADGQIVPWLASQTDLLANDWEYAPWPLTIQ